jgi:hypothetical protein
MLTRLPPLLSPPLPPKGSLKGSHTPCLLFLEGSISALMTPKSSNKRRHFRPQSNGKMSCLTANNLSGNKSSPALALPNATTLISTNLPDPAHAQVFFGRGLGQTTSNASL